MNSLLKLSDASPASLRLCAAVVFSSAMLAAAGAEEKKENGATPRRAAATKQAPAAKGPDPSLIHGKTVTVATTASKPTIKDLDKDVCFPVHEIQINGVDLVDVEEIRSAVAPIAWRCVGNVLAKSVVGAINNVYSQHGYVTTQGYVPPQNINETQRFVINVIVGRVAKIVPNETNANETLPQAFERARNADGPWAFASAVSGMANSVDYYLDSFQLFYPGWFPGLKTWLIMPVSPGDPLNIDKIQQGIDQLNRAPSQKVRAKLEPGDEPATSNVIVDIPRADSFRMSVGYDMNGRSLNGPNTTTQRAHVDLAKDNLLGLNDSWTGIFASGVNLNEVRSTLAVPVQWATFGVSGGYSEFLSEVSSDALYFMRKWEGTASASATISRDSRQSTGVDASFTYRNLERWINDTELTPQVVAIARAGASQTRFFENAQLVIGGGVSAGLPELGATPTPQNADYSVPRSRFIKVDGTMSYLRLFPEWGAFRFDAYGQWSNKALFQNDQIVLGSIATVRGFSRAPGFVDRGVYGRFEFMPDTHVDYLLGDYARQFSFASDALRGAKPFVFFDTGFGRDIASAQHVVRTAIGGGVRYNLGRLTCEWTAAAPLAWRNGFQSAHVDRFETYLSVSVKLF